MLLNDAKVTSFNVCELLRENQQGGKVTCHTQIRVKAFYSRCIPNKALLPFMLAKDE